jgi:hypothetical protein
LGIEAVWMSGSTVPKIGKALNRCKVIFRCIGGWQWGRRRRFPEHRYVRLLLLFSLQPQIVDPGHKRLLCFGIRAGDVHRQTVLPGSQFRLPSTVARLRSRCRPSTFPSSEDRHCRFSTGFSAIHLRERHARGPDSPALAPRNKRDQGLTDTTLWPNASAEINALSPS